jgi:hypothetical protein
MNKKILSVGLFLTVFLMASFVVMAQPTIPTPPSAPIDGGLSFLLAAGVGFGIRKITEKNKRSDNIDK